MNTRLHIAVAIALLAAPLVACGPTEFRGTYIEFEVSAADTGETLRTDTVDLDEPITLDPTASAGYQYEQRVEDNIRLGFPEPAPGTYADDNAVIEVWDEQNHDRVHYEPSGYIYCTCEQGDGKTCTSTALTIEEKDYGLVWGEFSAFLCGDGEAVSRVEVEGQFAAATEKDSF